ncbi:hypothetical protein BLX87_16320, partial [Bacillus sp. VT-16-64]
MRDLSLIGHKFGLISPLPKVARAPWVSADLHYGEETVWYLELTPPVSLTAYCQTEDILKQRRCGPFWCLSAVHKPELLKRHTFIAGSADGIIQTKADKADQRWLSVDPSPHELVRVSSISKGWLRARWIHALCPGGHTGEKPLRSRLVEAAGSAVTIGVPRWLHS